MPRRLAQHATTRRRGLSVLAKSLQSIYGWVASKLWDAAVGGASYPSTDPSRKIVEGWKPSGGPADAHLLPSLDQLIAQSRQLERGTPEGRALVEGRRAELVGTGITAEPDTGQPGLNALLRGRWKDWCDACGVRGESLWTLQRLASSELDTAGCILWRWLDLPDRVEQGLLPGCILALEAEWLATRPGPGLTGTFLRGIEVDRYGRPIAYHLLPPSAPLGTEPERVPAADILHAFDPRRPSQSHGEPRFAPLIERVLQDDEVLIAELKSARSAAGVAVVVSSDEGAMPRHDADGSTSTDPVTRIDAGSVAYVGSADRVTTVSHDRPSGAVRDFRTTVRGDLAAGHSISRVWLDRDGAAYNFANSRFDAIRTQMMVRPAASDWFGKAVCSWAYERFIKQALLAAGVVWPAEARAARRLLRHRLKPDVPPELDEQGAALAFSMSNGAGIQSRTDWLHERGRDPDEIAASIQAEHLADAQRRAERIAAAHALAADLMAKHPGLVVDWRELLGQAGSKVAEQAAAGATAAASKEGQA